MSRDINAAMNRNDITIRPARVEDAGAIAAMANELNLLHHNPGDLYTGELVETLAFGAAPIFFVLIAERSSERLGYAFFQDCFNSDLAVRAVWLLDVFVRESARSRGVGRSLLAAVARETMRRGASRSYGACSPPTLARGRSMPVSGPRTRTPESWSWTASPCSPWRARLGSSKA